MRQISLTVLTIILIFTLGQPCLAQTSVERFVIISDIHFSPYLTCSGYAPCPLIVKLAKSNVQQWPSILKQDDRSTVRYNVDTNYALLSIALTAAGKAASTYQAKFVLVLGDYLGHDYRRLYKRYSGDASLAGYQAFVRKTFVFLTQEIKKAFPAIHVYPVIGNNDSYNGNYRFKSSLFFHDLANDTHLSATATQSFLRAGYYAFTLPSQPNLRLIVLNTTLFSNFTKGDQVDALAQQQLRWFAAELANVQAQGQKAFIIMHIPNSIDLYATLRLRLLRIVKLWKPVYTNMFQASLSQYANVVAAIFTGHLHTDWYQVLRFPQAEVPIIGTTSISPLYGNHPGFKIIAFLPTSFQIENFVNFTYNLRASHLFGLAANLIHPQARCRECSMLKFMNLMKSFGEVSFLVPSFTVTQPNKFFYDQWSTATCVILDNQHVYHSCI